MPFEQSRIAIAPAFIEHPNAKDIPNRPMTSKQAKKAYKERNAGPKMTRAEMRKEEKEIREKARLEEEREKRLERDKRKRDKKKADEEAAKAERRKKGVPEKSKWVRPSQNRITGFIALGKRARDDDTTTETDTTRDNSVARDMRPPKNKRLSTDKPNQVSRDDSHDQDMDTVMLDITKPMDEDDISTVDSQEDNRERKLPKAASQRGSRPQISDDEIEPVIEKLRSSQLAEAPNFGTIRTQSEGSSFMSTGKFKTPAPKSKAPAGDKFAISQDYLAQCDEADASPTNSHTFIADAKISKTLAIAQGADADQAQKDLQLEAVQDAIHRTFSPLRARPSGLNSAPTPPAIGQFEASQDYDSYFATQAPQPASIKKPAPKASLRPSSRPKTRPQISDDEVEPAKVDQFAASQDYDAFFATQAPPPLPKAPAATRKQTPKQMPASNLKPQVAAKTVQQPKNDLFGASQDYDAYFATQAPAPPAPPNVARKEANKRPPVPNFEPPPQMKTVKPAIINQFEASQDYDAFFATQAPPPKAQPFAPKHVPKTSAAPVMPQVQKPKVCEQSKNNQFDASQDYDGFFSPDAPHAKPFQKPQVAKTPTPAQVPTSAKPAVVNQFAASQDYLSMLDGDDSDYDADIQPDLPVVQVRMSPENMAKHNAYNARQKTKVAAAPTPKMMLPPRAPATKMPAHATAHPQSVVRPPVTPNNLAQRREPLRQAQSAAPNVPRPVQAPKFKQHMPLKQSPRPVQKTPQSLPRQPVQRHSALPKPTQVLRVADDFEVLSGSQLMRELEQDEELNKKTPKPPAQPSYAGTNTKLSGGVTAPGRQPLKQVQQNAVKPPQFQRPGQKRASYPSGKPAENDGARGRSAPPLKAWNFAPKQVPAKASAPPRFQKSAPRPASKPIPKPAQKPLPSVEVADEMDIDFPSGSQIMREIAQEEEETRSRSTTVRPVSRPPSRQLNEPPKPKENVTARESTPVYKSFESNSQLLREMAEEEAEEKARKASETPCPQPQQAECTLPKQKALDQIIAPIEPVSFHILSDDMPSLSQVARELADEEAASQRAKESGKSVALPQNTQGQRTQQLSNTNEPARLPARAPDQPNNQGGAIETGGFEVSTNSHLTREMGEEEHEKVPKHAPALQPSKANNSSDVATNKRAGLAPAPMRPQRDWLTNAAIGRNDPVSLRRGRPANLSARNFHSPQTTAMAPPAAKSFEVDFDSQIAREMAAEEAAFTRKLPAPLPPPKTKVRRQFSGLTAKPPKPAMPTASTPQDAPPSTQRRFQQPSSTPLSVRRARKPLFFQEKPEDRETSVVFDSKVQADRDERRRKEKEAEIAEEQRKQDAWLRELCGTQKD